jgi:hypothetical protein
LFFGISFSPGLISLGWYLLNRQVTFRGRTIQVPLFWIAEDSEGSDDVQFRKLPTSLFSERKFAEIKLFRPLPKELSATETFNQWKVAPARSYERLGYFLVSTETLGDGTKEAFCATIQESNYDETQVLCMLNDGIAMGMLSGDLSRKPIFYQIIHAIQ